MRQLVAISSTSELTLIVVVLQGFNNAVVRGSEALQQVNEDLRTLIMYPTTASFALGSGGVSVVRISSTRRLTDLVLVSGRNWWLASAIVSACDALFYYDH